MNLTPAQLQTIQTHINASADMNTRPNDETDEGNVAIVNLFNAPATPNTFWAWRTDVSFTEITSNQNDLGVAPPADAFNWTTYKNQGTSEILAFGQMFQGGRTSFALPNLRSGIGKIHGDASANTAHCMAIGRRLTKRIEKLLATGTGSTASPATFGVGSDGKPTEGVITLAQVSAARNL